MYVVQLLKVITHFYFVEVYFTNPEIRFGYGLPYEHRRQMLHGLNRYHLLGGVDISKFTFTKYSYKLD